jgi:hypothetical protein
MVSGRLQLLLVADRAPGLVTGLAGCWQARARLRGNDGTVGSFSITMLAIRGRWPAPTGRLRPSRSRIGDHAGRPPAGHESQQTGVTPRPANGTRSPSPSRSWRPFRQGARHPAGPPVQGEPVRPSRPPLARHPPDVPARPGRRRRHHATASVLHRDRQIPAGKRPDTADRRCAHGAATRTQHPAGGSWLASEDTDIRVMTEPDTVTSCQSPPLRLRLLPKAWPGAVSPT